MVLISGVDLEYGHFGFGREHAFSLDDLRKCSEHVEVVFKCKLCASRTECFLEMVDHSKLRHGLVKQEIMADDAREHDRVTEDSTGLIGIATTNDQPQLQDEGDDDDDDNDDDGNDDDYDNDKDDDNVLNFSGDSPSNGKFEIKVECATTEAPSGGREKRRQTRSLRSSEGRAKGIEEEPDNERDSASSRKRRKVSIKANAGNDTVAGMTLRNSHVLDPSSSAMENLPSFKCLLCRNRSLGSQEEHDVHMKCHVENADVKFQCVECDYRTDDWSYLTEHFIQHPGLKAIFASTAERILAKRKKRRRSAKQFKCVKCSRRLFETSEELELHDKMHTGDGELGFKCPQCDYTHQKWAMMSTHILRHNDIAAIFGKKFLGDYQCAKCKKSFTNSILYRHHMKMHTTVNRVCHICGKDFRGTWPKSFRRHVDRCKNITHRCGTCNYTTKSTDSFRAHMKIHDGRGYTCEICNIVLPSKSRYEHHKERHDPDHKSKYVCEYCGQPYASSQALKGHVVRIHTKSGETLKCPQCSFTAHLKADLSRHEARVHNKAFKCELCDYQTASEMALKQHMTYHGPDRMFACTRPGCSYRAKSNKLLYDHMHDVHLIMNKMFECSICGRSYKKRTSLERHFVKHTGTVGVKILTKHLTISMISL